MTKIYPLVIAAAILVIAGPAAVDFVGGYTLNLAGDTVAQMQEIAK